MTLASTLPRRMTAGDLNTTQKEYEGAWDTFNRVRSTSATVTIPKRTLQALLTDHGVMCGALGIEDFT
jgi:hypothetical protein